MAYNFKDAKSYLGKDEIAERDQYSQNLMNDMNKADIDEKTKETYYRVMMRYKENNLAANVFGIKFNNLIPERKRIIELYNREQNTYRANEYLKKLNSIEAEMYEYKAYYDHFDGICASFAQEVYKIDDEIDARLELKGYDTGLDDRPQSPKVNKRFK